MMKSIDRNAVATIFAILMIGLLGAFGYGASHANADATVAVSCVRGSAAAAKVVPHPIGVPKITRKQSPGHGTLRNGKYSVRFAFWQDHELVRPQADRIIPLRRAPFEIRFSGDISHVSVLLATGSRITGALRRTKRPILTLSGMGGAYDTHQPFLADKTAKLVSWAAICEMTFGSGSKLGKKLTAILRQRFRLPPVVLEASCMWLHAPSHARKFTWKIRSLYANGHTEPFNKKILHIAVFMYTRVDKLYIFSLKGRFLRLKFHG